MKQLKMIILLTVLMSMVGAKAFAYQHYDFQVNSIYYTITSSTDKTVKVTYQSAHGSWRWDDDFDEFMQSIPEGYRYIIDPDGDDPDDDTSYFYTQSDYSGQITIPSTVTFNGIQYTVIGIGEYAFMNCRNITKVTLSNTVRYIGQYAFRYCI